jgi:hypothetical protein
MGANCDNNSNHMIQFCLNRENNCALSFQQMIKTQLTIGQQLDIQIVTEYLQEVFSIILTKN